MLSFYTPVEWDLEIDRIMERNYFSFQHYVVLWLTKMRFFESGIILFRVVFRAPLPSLIMLTELSFVRD